MLYCPIRQQWVAALPEEGVRQALLSQMIEQGGYPKSLIVVEKSLAELPHLEHRSGVIPNRRADILCFGKEANGSLVPLLLIECKATPLTDRVVNQVIGYNAHVKAPFLAIANQSEVRTGWFDFGEKRYLFVNRLPDYKELSRS